MKRFNYFLFILLLTGINACEEEGRYEPARKGNPPGQITNISYEPLYGGAKFFYTVPNDEDLLQVEAEYTNEKNKTFLFSASYFNDSLEVYGFSAVKPYTVRLYAVNRNGVRSKVTEQTVTPMEPAYLRVANSLIVIPGFSSLLVDWANELQQNVNVYLDFSYTQGGTPYAFTSVFASNLLKDRRSIDNLFLTRTEPLNVKIRIEDSYGNMTDPKEFTNIILLEDIKIPKDKWTLPNPNDSVGGIPMCFGEGREGRNRYVIDDIIDYQDNLNFMHTNSRGRTGRTSDGNMPWNFIIDLGDYYELSRIITTQRHSGGLANINRGQYYQSENVGVFRLYIWDEEKNGWSDYINQHSIPVPRGITELEFVRLGEAGDMAYFYPDNPQYTKPTRWFRYEATKSFNGNYTLEDANCLSEITLYGRKANR